MKTYLVTGSQGFLGRYLVANLLLADPDVRLVGLGRSRRNDDEFTHHIMLGKRSVPAPLPAELLAVRGNPRYSYIAGDLRDLSELVATLCRVRPQVVFHLASALRDEPVDALFQINVEGSVRLIEAIAAARLENPKVVLVSSGGVYGIPAADGLPLVETAPCQPNDLYSISKLSAEYALTLIARQARVPLVTSRVFNVLGAGQDERHVCGRIMSQLTAILSGAVKHSLQIGALETTRDFIDARDVAAGIVAIEAAGQPGEVYNVASGIETSIAEVLRLSLEITGLDGNVDVNRLPPRPSDVPRHFGNIGRLAALGFRTRYTLRDSLQAIHDYYRQCWREAEPETGI